MLQFLGIDSAGGSDEIIGIELRYRLDPTNLTKIMQNMIRNTFECRLTPNLQIPKRILKLFGDRLLHSELLFLFFGDLREHDDS